MIEPLWALWNSLELKRQRICQKICILKRNIRKFFTTLILNFATSKKNIRNSALLQNFHFLTPSKNLIIIFMPQYIGQNSNFLFEDFTANFQDATKCTANHGFWTSRAALWSYSTVFRSTQFPSFFHDKWITHSPEFFRRVVQ